MNNIFQEGYDAYRECVPAYEGNPYQINSPERREWNEGWDAAYDDALNGVEPL